MKKNKMELDDILFNLNDEIIPISELANADQKVVIYDDYVCDKNQRDIIDYFRIVVLYTCHNPIIKHQKT